MKAYSKTMAYKQRKPHQVLTPRKTQFPTPPRMIQSLSIVNNEPMTQAFVAH